MSLITVNLNIDKGLDEYEKYEENKKINDLLHKIETMSQQEKEKKKPPRR